MKINNGTDKIVILHVDDNYDALKLFQLKIKNAFEITSAESAKKALEILKNRSFDAVITDYEMPETNGMELLKIIKSRYPNLPVIFYTGQGNEEIAREAFMNGVSDYITKSRQEIAHTEKIINSIHKAVREKRADDALEESHRRFSTLIENVPGIVYRCINDRNWTMEFLNDNCLDITGYHPDEFINNRVVSYGSIIHPDDVDMVWDTIQIAMEKRTHFYLEYKIIRKDGKIRHVIEKGRGVYDNNNQLLALEGVILDDTSRKQAEKNLIQVNRVLMAIRDINRLIVREKKTERLLSRACEILVKSRGYCLAWIGMVEEGSPLIMPVAWSGADDGFLDMVQFPISLALQDSCPICRAVSSGEASTSRNLAQDPSEIFWRQDALKRGYRSGAFIPLKVKNSIIGALNVFSDSPYVFDVTELDLLKDLADDISFALQAIEDEARRNKAELALKESEIRYRSLFEQANDAVFLETLDGRILDVNRKACQMLGYAREELMSLTVDQLITPASRDKLPAVIEAVKQGKSFCMEGQNLKKDGTVVDVETSISTMQIEDQVRVLTLVRDITDRNRVRDEMEKLKLRFESVIENTPMVAIQGFNPDGTIIHWNKESERIYNFSKEEALGRNIRELIFSEKSREDFNRIVEKVIKSKKAERPVQLNTRSSDGTGHWVLSTIFPTFENNAIAELFSVEVDITSMKHAEEALRVSEERYRGIFENLTSGIGTCRIIDGGQEGIFTGWNREAEDIFGIKKSNIIGRRITEVFPGAVSIGLMDAIENVHKTGVPCFLEPKLYQDNVYEQWIEYVIYSNPSTDELVIILDDVTERIESEVALKKNRARLSNLIESQKDVIFEIDEKGRFTFISPASKNLFNYEPSEVVGHHFGDYLTPDSRRLLNSFLESHMNDGVSSYHNLECDCYHRSGSICHLSVTTQVIFNEDGVYSGSRGSIRNITETKIALEELRKSEEKYRILVESAADAIFIFDHELRFISANREAARAMGLDSRTMVGKRMTELFPPEISEQQANSLNKVFQTGEPLIAMEAPNRTVDGIRWYNTTLSPIRDSSGRVTNVVGIARDVTEHKKAHEALKEIREFREDLVEMAPVGICMAESPDGKFTIFNNMLEKITGYGKEEIPDIKTWFEKVYPDRTRREQLFAQWMEDLSDINFVSGWRELDITVKSGAVKKILAFCSKIRSGAIIIYSYDTSELAGCNR